MSKLENFAALGLSESTLNALERKGFEEPTEIQRECIPLLLQEKVDVIGQAQTGTGKTAAFALPILETIDEFDRSTQALILTPTRELCVQVAEEINSLKGNKRIEITPIYGGASMQIQLNRLRRGVQIVVGTPGRILDHLERGTLKLGNIKFAILDEADEMLDMGFIEDIENILKSSPDDKRMLMFSATMPKPILKLAEEFMKDYKLVKIHKNEADVPLTDQIYFEVREGDKTEALSRIIDIQDNFYGVVFCRTKVQCDEIASKLSLRGYDAEALHGDLSQKQREFILNKMKNHQISILIATDVAARGLDIHDLTHVINYSIPQDPEVYIHRIGRTGRAGKSGTAITFITPQEARKFNFIKRASKSEIRKEFVPTPNDVIEAKKASIKDLVLSSLNEDSSNFEYLAADLLQDNSAESVVASLLNHFFGEDLDISRYEEIKQFRDASSRDRDRNRDRDRDTDRRSRARDDRDERDGRYNREKYDKGPRLNIDEHGQSRLFIAKGRKDGFTKRALANFLIDECGVKDAELNNIQVMEEFSFVNAPFDVAEHVLRVFSNTTGREGKPLIVRAKPEGGSNERREDRGFRGRGSDSRGRRSSSSSSRGRSSSSKSRSSSSSSRSRGRR